MGLRAFVLSAVPIAIAAVSVAGAGGASTRTSITVWASAQPVVTSYGGLTYGGYTPPSGAMITEQREVDVDSGELRIANIATTADPASVQLRSLSDPNGVTISEQRFIPGATSPDEILARHVGDPITVVTAKAEINGVLRAVDAQTLVVEVGAADQRRLQVMRRDGYVQDIRLPAGASADKPSFVWRLASKKKGKQTVELTYRADGMSWTADYLAILDDSGKSIDFSAWATVKNATGTSFDNTDLTLVSGGGQPAQMLNAYAAAPARQATAPSRFTVPSPVRLGNGESVQVELVPARRGAKARAVVAWEAMADPSANFQAYPGSDCSLNATTVGTGRGEAAVELDVPSAGPLPDGRVRLFRRAAKGDRLDVVNEDQLHSSAGVARIPLAPDTEIVGERRQPDCNSDERARTLREKIEVKIENKSKRAAEVVVREFMWRWPMWRIDPADETVRGVRAGAQTQEYRVDVPAGGKKTLTYTVTYSW
jgi:hypothetical protein